MKGGIMHEKQTDGAAWYGVSLYYMAVVLIL